MSANPSEQRRGGERRGRQPSQRDRQLQERAGERQAIAESREELAEQVSLINVDPQQDVEVIQTEGGPQVQLTDDAAQRQAEQLRQQAAEDSDRFDESDFTVDRSGGEINVEPTQAAIERERRKEAAAEFESQSEFINNVSPEEVELTDEGAKLPDEIIEEAENRAKQQAQQQAAADILAERIEGFGFAKPSDVVKQDGEYVLSQSARNDLQSAVKSGVIDEEEISNINESVSADNLTANSAAVAEKRQEFAESIESGSAFGDLPDGVDPASLVDNVDPQSDIVVEDGSLTLADDVQGQINSRLESDALQQQREEFANALESGEAFESGEAPDALGSVDPQTDVTIEDGELTLADETQADLIEAQIREQAGETPSLITDGVLQRAASQDEIIEAVEEQIENQSGTDVRPGLIEDANLRVTSDGTIEAERLLLNSRRFDDFRDVGAIPDDVLGDAILSVDATEEFQEQIEQSIAEQISERNVVEVSRDQIDISGGSVDVQTPELLTIEAEEIDNDGLSEEGQDDFARRQLQSIQTTEGISVDTPVGSQAYANVSARLAQAADGGGSLSSATRIVAASETVDNIGDLDDMPDARIIAGLDPQQAEERLGIDATTVREAQSDIQQRRQQLESDPGSVLEDIADNEDEFVNDATRIGVAGERGQRIRQAARSRINELEADIAANDGDVSPEDVGLTLTDDLSGIRSINDAGRQAIAEQVDEQLPNFDSSEINVGVSDGEITTSIEDSVRERFTRNAQRVQEIQIRNDIADSTEGIGRRDIEVDAGEGVSPSDELVAETLGSDVEADVDSFEQLEQIQRQQQAQQQITAIDERIANQPIGPDDVQFREVDGGVVAELTPEAERRVDATRVDLESAIDNSEAGDTRNIDPTEPLTGVNNTLVTNATDSGGLLSESANSTDGLLPGQLLGVDVSENRLSGLADAGQQFNENITQEAATVDGGVPDGVGNELVADTGRVGADAFGNLVAATTALPQATESTIEFGQNAPLNLDSVQTAGSLAVAAGAGTVRAALQEPETFVTEAALGAVAGGVLLRGARSSVNAARTTNIDTRVRSFRQASTNNRQGLGDLVEANPQSADEIADVIDNSVGASGRRRGFSNADRFDSVETIDPEFGGVRRFDTSDVTRELRFGGRRRRDISQRASRIDEGGVSQRESADLSDLDFSKVDTQVGGSADEIEVPATSSSADEIASEGTRNSGLSESLGSGGRGSLLDADAVDAARGVSEPGAVRRAIGDLRRDSPTADIRTRVDTAERAQIGLAPRRGADDAVEFADERLSANLRQQTITRRQRELDEATEGGSFEGEPTAFGDDTRRAQAEADADAIARQEQLADDATSAEVSEAGDDLSAAVSSAEAAERSIAAEQAEEPAVSADTQETVAAAAEQQAAGEIEAEVDQFGTVTEADVGEVTGSPTLTGEQTPVTGQTLFEVGEVAVTGTETAQQVSTIDDTAAAQSAEVVSESVEVGSFGDVNQELDQQQDGAVGIDIGSGAGIDIGVDSVVDVGSDTAVDTVLDVSQTEAAASATDQSATQDTRLTDRLLDPANPRAPRAPRRPGRPPTPPSIRITPEEDDDGGGSADGDGFDLLSLSAGVGDRGPAVGFVAEQLTAFATGGFSSRELPEQTSVPTGAELTTATLADPDPSEEDAVESVAETFGIEFDDETEETLI